MPIEIGDNFERASHLTAELKTALGDCSWHLPRLQQRPPIRLYELARPNYHHF